jgi:uncharacterized OsmC-like protein
MDLITVAQKGQQEFAIQVRTHAVTSDMAVSEGGQDRGPHPVELLVGALGACIGKTIARYCQTIQCPAEGIVLYLTYQFADSPRRVKNIVIDLELPEGFPAERKEAIRNIAHSCPVHNTLKNPPEIDLEVSG